MPSPRDGYSNSTINVPTRILRHNGQQQAGYFTAAQARWVGFGYPLITYHTRSGRFRRAARGVYRLARFPGSPNEDLFVAWLRTGPDSVISHESALSLYGLSDVLPGEIHVIVPRNASRRRRGMRQHTHSLRPDEVTRREGLPVTTVARTVADVIAAGIAEEQAVQAIEQALRRGLTTEEALMTQADRRGGSVARLIRRRLREAR